MRFLLFRIKEKLFKIGKAWDKCAVCKECAVEFAEKYINQEPDRTLKDNPFVYTMEYVLASSAESINERWRSDCASDEDHRIASALDKYCTSSPIVVYRGVCEHVYECMVANAKGIKGVDLLEKGFMSTSLVKGCEIPYDIKLRIYIPYGNKCVFMGDVNYELETYYEVAVQRHARLKIISIDEKYINCLLIGTA